MRFGDIDPEEVQNVSLPKHPATRELSNVFHRKIDEVVDSMYHCPMCKECFFDRKPPDSKGDCKLCRSSMKKYNIQIMSVKNDMDPFRHGYPAMLISPAYPFMKVYTFANGATGFRGQILNVQQDISDDFAKRGSLMFDILNRIKHRSIVYFYFVSTFLSHSCNIVFRKSGNNQAIDMQILSMTVKT